VKKPSQAHNLNEKLPMGRVEKKERIRRIEIGGLSAALFREEESNFTLKQKGTTKNCKEVNENSFMEGKRGKETGEGKNKAELTPDSLISGNRSKHQKKNSGTNSRKATIRDFPSLAAYGDLTEKKQTKRTELGGYIWRKKE